MGKKDDVFLTIAQSLATLGTCDRKQVGALITRDGRCISWGYNGAPPDMRHCWQNAHGWIDEAVKNLGYQDIYRSYSMLENQMLMEESMRLAAENGCRNATHAEANTLAFAARQGISTDGGTLYVTVSPCENCARLLIAAGIKRVVALEEYRDDSGIRLLQDAHLAIIVAGIARG